MFRKKLTVLVLNHDENEKKITSPQKEEKKKNKISSKKILISLLFVGVGVGVYYYQDEVVKLTKDKINIDVSAVLESNKDLKNNIPIFDNSHEKTQNIVEEKLPEVNLGKNKEKETELKEIMQEKRTEAAKEEDSSLSTTNSTETNQEFPNVVIKQSNEIKENISSEENNKEMEAEILKKELALVLKNSIFTINAKKEAVSLFINNINHNVNEVILNNDKFKLSNISLICNDNQLPKFKFVISSNNDIPLYEKELFYSENKKILLSFDSLSVTDLDSNVENIFLPEEQIFKDFRLNSIEDSSGDLKFEFGCLDKRIVIVGKELSEIK